MEQAQWDMIDRMTQAAASIASDRSAPEWAHALPNSALEQEQIRQAQEQTRAARAQAKLPETKEKDAESDLFIKHNKQYEGIEARLETMNNDRLSAALKLRQESLLSAINRMAENIL